MNASSKISPILAGPALVLLFLFGTSPLACGGAKAKCGPGTHAEGQLCVADGDGGAACGPGTHLQAGQCVPDETVSADAGTPDAGSPDAGPRGFIISGSQLSAWEAETSIAVGPNGRIAVAWNNIPRVGTFEIGYTFSNDDGATFAPPSAIASPGGRDASDPSLAVDAQGNFVLTWIGIRSGSTSHVYVARASPGASSFDLVGEATDPADDTKFYDHPTVAVTNQGTYLVAFAMFNGGAAGDGTLVAARSADGASWQRSVMASGHGFRNIATPCPPAHGQRIYATFSDANLGIGLRWSDDDGATWPDANQSVVFPDGMYFGDPKCVSEGNDVWIMDGYAGGNTAPDQYSPPPLAAIRLAHSSNGGATIDAPIEIEDAQSGPLFQRPVLTIEDSSALDVMYYAGAQSKDPKGSYRRARSTDRGASFGPSKAMGGPVLFDESRITETWIGDYTGVAYRAGQIYTSYTDNSQGLSHIAFYKAAVP